MDRRQSDLPQLPFPRRHAGTYESAPFSYFDSDAILTYVQGVESAHAALIAENARLREALRLIATPGYGIELGDTDDVRAEYWSEQTEKCRCIARAFFAECEAEARQIVRTA